MSPTYPFDHAHTENPGPGTRSPSIDRWEDEGGPAAPRRRAPSTTVKTPASFLPLNREQRDTAAGCRDRASADLLEAATMATVNARARMESSAANWTLRAELLDRLEASFEARKAAAAKSAGGEEPVRS